MTDTNMFRFDSKTQTIVPVTCGTSFFHPDALVALFGQLADGQTPNFIEMMAALADVSILMTPDGPCSDCKK